MPLIIVLLLLAVNVDAAFSYNINYYGESEIDTSVTTEPIPFYAENDGVLELKHNLFATFNASPTFNYNSNYLSPYGVIYATTSGTKTTNSTCSNLGYALKNYTTSAFAENRNTVTNDAAYFKAYTESGFTFTTSDRFLKLYGGNVTDSENHLVNRYQCVNCFGDSVLGATNITPYFNSETIGRCNLLHVEKADYQYVSGGIDDLFVYTLFNSTTGNITYSSRFYPTNALDNRFHIIYPFDSPNNPTTLCNTENCSGNTLLDANRLYVYAVGGTPAIGTARTHDINLTIDLAIADYVCGDWSDCDEEGLYTRVCIDSNGIQPDRVDSEPCSIIVLENATLGFEEFVRVDDVWKCTPTWFLGCGYELNTTLRDTPLNWTIGENSFAKRDFLKMTEEWATEGSRSLKMWYIPPKRGEVIINSTGYPTSCGNATGGTVPYLSQNISNTTFRLSFNVTFPAENMLISFDTKGCENNVLQHSALLDEGFIFNVTFCEQRCYARRCDDVPDSRYVFNILDTVTGLSVMGSPYFDRASTIIADTVTIDLSNLGLIVGRSYTLVFAVYPENLNDNTCLLYTSPSPRDRS